LKRFQPKGKIETGKPNIKLVFLWFRYDLEFGSCLLKENRNKEIKKEKKKRKKKKKEWDWVSVFPK
jgi:hypothetical protein